jgi:hypothetical protein
MMTLEYVSQSLSAKAVAPSQLSERICAEVIRASAHEIKLAGMKRSEETMTVEEFFT